MYAEKLKHFENVENLGGKAWQHAVMCDFFNNSLITDCSIPCFHYQQLFEFLLKHILETRTQYGAYPDSNKLDKLLLQATKQTKMSVDYEKYTSSLITLTVCADLYHYDTYLSCATYQHIIDSLNPLLDQLAEFSKPQQD